MSDTSTISLFSETGQPRGLGEVIAEANASNLGILGDLRLTVNFCFKLLGLPNITAIQADICQMLQYGEESLSWEQRNRVIVMAYRGVGKTWITAIFVCFCLNINRDWKAFIVSKTKEFAGQVAEFIRKLIDLVPFFSHLSPRNIDLTEDDRNKDTQFAFNVSGCTPNPQPSVKAAGITGQVTGNRSDLIIADDVETLDNSVTTKKRNTVREATREFEALLKPGGKIVYLGTPQIEDSLYIDLCMNRGYTARVWPARYPNVEQIKNKQYLSRLAPLIKNAWAHDKVWKVIDGQRFSDADMNQRELAYGKRGFNLQFMLDTSTALQGATPLQLKDLILGQFSGLRAPANIIHGTHRVSPDDLYTPTINDEKDYFTKPASISTNADEWATYETIHMFIDPSGDGQDETAYAVVGSLSGTLFLLASGGFIEGYSTKTLEALANVCKKFKVNSVDTEDNFGGGMFRNLLKPVMVRISPETMVMEESTVARRQKELRICDTLEPLMNQHRLVVLEDVVRLDEQTALNKDGEFSADYSLFYQMSRITRERGCLEHDDRIDALAGCVWKFLDAMRINTADSADKVRKEEEERRYQDYLDRKLAFEKLEELMYGGEVSLPEGSTGLLSHLKK